MSHITTADFTIHTVDMHNGIKFRLLDYLTLDVANAASRMYDLTPSRID